MVSHGLVSPNDLSPSAGYIFAAAHAGIAHDVEPRLQLRDVDGQKSWEQAEKVPLIHMGRVFFWAAITMSTHKMFVLAHDSVSKYQSVCNVMVQRRL